MTSADNDYGKLQLIDPDDDSDDGGTASAVKSEVNYRTAEYVYGEGQLPNLRLGFIVILNALS